MKHPLGTFTDAVKWNFIELYAVFEVEIGKASIFSDLLSQSPTSS